MATRQPPSPAVEPKNDTVRRTSSTAICLRSTPLSLSGALKNEKIGLRLRGDAPRDRMIGVDGERVRRLHCGRRRIGMREHEARHAISERRLADALRARDQKRMRHAAGAIGGKQCRFGVGMAEQRRRGARMRRRVCFVVVGCSARRHDFLAPASLRCLAARRGDVSRIEPRADRVPDLRCATIFLGRARHR